MANIRILLPEETVNYIQNPSLRVDTTGYTAVSSTITRDLTRARLGISSLKVVTSGLVNREGFFYRVSDLVGISDVVTISAYVRGAGKVRIRLIDYPTGGEWASKTISMNDLRWKRIEVTGRCTGSNDVRLYVESDEGTARVLTFYADGLQMERKTEATSYCDGTQAGCRWNIISDASRSSRSAYTRQGGKWFALAGTCRPDNDIYATVIGGMGMANISNNVQPFSLTPGSYYQNTKINSRIIIMNFTAKNERLRIVGNLSLSPLHKLRQQLIDILKPDKTSGGQSFLLEYSDGALPVYIDVRYEAGLEGEWDIRNGWVNSFPIRFLATSPMFYEDDQEVASLKFVENIGILNYFGSRSNGAWNNMNYGTNSSAGHSRMAMGKNGEIYAMVGTYVNADARAIYPNLPANRIAKWNGSYFETLGAGANTGIRAVAVAPNGYLYVAGNFTSIGGIAANYVAYWDGSAWNAMGAGVNGQAWSIAVSPDGTVYVGGDFTTAGGVNASKIAKWTGAAWYSMGNLKGLDNAVKAIAIRKDGTVLYAGGSFAWETGSTGTALSRVAAYDPVTNLFSAVFPASGGFNGTVLQLVISADGILYACGDFTVSGSDAMNHIAKYDGSQWVCVGNGVSAAASSIYAIDVDSKGNLLAGGKFQQIGAVNARSLALWNGSVWSPFDIDISTGGAQVPELWNVFFGNDDDIYFSGVLYVDTNSSNASGITTINNVGSAEVSPKMYIRGSGTLRWIENQSTGKRVYLDLPILSGEEVYIDFEIASIRSAVRGDLSYAILPGSDFKAFTLIPGDNKLAVFMKNDVNGFVSISYTPSHWSADAIARTEVY